MLAVEQIEEIDWWKWIPGAQEQIGGIDKQAIDGDMYERLGEEEIGTRGSHPGIRNYSWGRP